MEIITEFVEMIRGCIKDGGVLIVSLQCDNDHMMNSFKPEELIYNENGINISGGHFILNISMTDLLEITYDDEIEEYFINNGCVKYFISVMAAM